MRPGRSPGTPSRREHAVSAELKEATLSGARMSFFAQLAIEIIAFGGSVVLARLIAPDQFGLVAVALIAPSIALALSFQGIASPLVQRPEIRQAHLEVATLLSLALGLAMSSALLVLAPPLAGPVFGDATAHFLQLVAPVFVLSSLRAVPFAVLQRSLDFGRLTRVEVVSRLAGSAAAVGLAVAGVEGEAIVIGALVTAAVSALLLLMSSPVTLPRWHTAEVRELAGFGTSAAFASLTYHATRNADYAVLATKLSTTQVGFYWRAFQLGVEYQSKLTTVMLRVAFPVLSRAQSIEQMRSLRLRITRVHSSVILPLLATFIVAAPTLVPWLYGSRWAPAVLPAQILAVAGMAVALTSGIGSIMLATGNPRSLVVWNATTLAVLVGAVVWTAQYGLTAACLGVTGANLASLAGSYYFLLHREVGIRLSALALEALPGIAASAAIVAVGLPVRRALDAAGAESMPVLLVIGLVSTALHLGILRVLFAAAWKDLAALSRRLVPGSRRPSPAAPSTRTATEAPATSI